MDGTAAVQIARSDAQREQLAKDWLARIVDRTPLDELPQLPLPWLAAEAPELIAAVLDAISERGGEVGRRPRSRHGPWRTCAVGPRPRSGFRRTSPRFKPCSSALCDASSRRRTRSASRARSSAWPTSSARSTARSARELVGAQAGTEALDPITGLPGPAQLDGWLGSLLAEQRRYGHSFSLALIDVDGLGASTTPTAARRATGC